MWVNRDRGWSHGWGVAKQVGNPKNRGMSASKNGGWSMGLMIGLGLSSSPPHTHNFPTSASDDNIVQQWDSNGCQIWPTYEGRGVAFSLDGTHFVSWGEQDAIVWNSDSRCIIAEPQVSSGDFKCCCFSPNSKFVAGSASHKIHIWDIIGSDPQAHQDPHWAHRQYLLPNISLLPHLSI